jgi:hypothetical protein
MAYDIFTGTVIVEESRITLARSINFAGSMIIAFVKRMAGI